jgi:pyrroline-5-carboxylate reductase
VLEGSTVYSLGKSAKPDDCSTVEYLFGAVGKCWRVNETLVDAVTGISGSGSAYMYLILEALMEEGVSFLSA